jgi:hypothetical protein
MKKNIILLIIVLVLAAAGLYLFKSDSGITSAGSTANDYDFAIPDTASITKIVIEDKSPSKVSLTRENGVWMVNGKAPARVDAIAVLLETFHHIGMKSYVSKEAQPAVLKRLDVFGKHVEVYAGDKLLKSFRVGTETPDMLGSYMMLDGANEPFAMHLPGFNGYLNSRFFTDENQWRKRAIWGFDNRNIKTIQVSYKFKEEESFRIEIENKQPTLFNADRVKIENVNLSNLYEYLAAFRNTSYEGAIVESDGIYSKMDSVKAAGEVYSVYVEPIDGDPIELKAYRVRAMPGTFDVNDQPRIWDQDRLYGIIDNDTYVLIQNFGMQNITRSLSDFK